METCCKHTLSNLPPVPLVPVLIFYYLFPKERLPGGIKLDCLTLAQFAQTIAQYLGPVASVGKAELDDKRRSVNGGTIERRDSIRSKEHYAGVILQSLQKNWLLVRSGQMRPRDGIRTSHYAFRIDCGFRAGPLAKKDVCLIYQYKGFPTFSPSKIVGKCAFHLGRIETYRVV